MERFNLTRYDLMTMTWTELMMLFASVSEEDERPAEDVRYATDEDILNWI